ncbi:hypothetical protein [Fulvivirga imtechensis]|nr:hypothetical protein [Fulvivirga imtechensis]
MLLIVILNFDLESLPALRQIFDLFLYFKYVRNNTIIKEEADESAYHLSESGYGYTGKSQDQSVFFKIGSFYCEEAGSW